MITKEKKNMFFFIRSVLIISTNAMSPGSFVCFFYKECRHGQKKKKKNKKKLN
jgi:hypothetical protein